MKQVFGIFAALILMPTFQVQAWLGGPWSNNSYQENGDDGIYEAIATMTNGVGMYRWAVNNNNAGGTAMTGNFAGSTTSNVMFGGLVAAASPHVWYYKGIVYYGRCFGIVNSDMAIVSVTGNAANDGVDGSAQGQDINGVILASPGAPTIVGTGIPPGSSLGGVGNNRGWANSNFIAEITQKYPNKRFHGKGTVSFNGIPDVSYQIFTATINVDTDGDGTDDGTIQTVHNELYGDSGTFSQVGHKRTFIVFGTQVSTQVTG